MISVCSCYGRSVLISHSQVIPSLNKANSELPLVFMMKIMVSHYFLLGIEDSYELLLHKLHTYWHIICHMVL